jgi:hypothetical protein
VHKTSKKTLLDWTNERRKRHGLQPDATYALCDHMDETGDHLLCSYVYTREVWSRLLAAMVSIATAPQHDAFLLGWWMSAREDVPQVLRRSFDSPVLLVTCDLWKECNRHMFDRRSVTPFKLIAAILEEAAA